VHAQRTRRARVRLAAVLAAIAIVAGFEPGPTNAALVQLLPDLRMARPLYLRITTSSSGRRLLRMKTTIANIGKGHFALLATRLGTGTSTMKVQQRIWRNDNTTRYVPTSGTARFAGDGHNHWHIRRVATYELVDSKARRIRRDAKVGFCFFDTGVYNSATPGFRPTKKFFASGCGGRSSLRAYMGISIGWGDTYGAGLAYQWIDVTGVPAGTYWVVVTADKENFYLESNEQNNCAWAKVRLSSGAASVSTIARGQGCKPPGVVPPTPTPSPTPSPTPAVSPSASPTGG
jgi:hypothetical protein